MRYYQHKVDMLDMVYEIKTYLGEGWHWDNPWEFLEIQPRQQALIIENADRLPWEEWGVRAAPFSEETSAPACPEEKAEMEEHYLEILRGTYPGYVLGGVTVYYEAVALHFFKEGSPFYFSALMDHDRGCYYDISLIGPKTITGVCPHYRVQCTKTGGGTTITERRGDTARVMKMYPKNPGDEEACTDLYLDVWEFMDI